MTTNKKEPNSRDYGRMGGLKTLELYGAEHFREAGRIGGKKVSQNREHMSALGQKGGRSRGVSKSTERKGK